MLPPLVGEMTGRPERGKRRARDPDRALHCTERASPPTPQNRFALLLDLLYFFVLRISGRKTGSHFGWICSKFRATASKGIIRVSNVVEFRKPQKPKEPKKVPPGLRKVLIVAGVIAVFVLVWAWFNFFGG